MPDGLTFQATLAVVAVALGLSFGVAVLVGGGASAAKPTAKRGPALVQSTPGSAMDLLTAARAVPVLRAPREQLRSPTRVARRSVTPALTFVSAPVAPAESARPTQTAVPRDVAPPPPRVVPAPTPKPQPTPTATPESSGDFDITGDFDTTGEPVREVTHQIPHTNRTSGGVAK